MRCQSITYWTLCILPGILLASAGGRGCFSPSIGRPVGCFYCAGGLIEQAASASSSRRLSTPSDNGAGECLPRFAFVSPSTHAGRAPHAAPAKRLRGTTTHPDTPCCSGRDARRVEEGRARPAVAPSPKVSPHSESSRPCCIRRRIRRPQGREASPGFLRCGRSACDAWRCACDSATCGLAEASASMLCGRGRSPGARQTSRDCSVAVDSPLWYASGSVAKHQTREGTRWRHHRILATILDSTIHRGSSTLPNTCPPSTRRLRCARGARDPDGCWAAPSCWACCSCRAC